MNKITSDILYFIVGNILVNVFLASIFSIGEPVFELGIEVVLVPFIVSTLTFAVLYIFAQLAKIKARNKWIALITPIFIPVALPLWSSFLGSRLLGVVLATVTAVVINLLMNKLFSAHSNNAR